jgi:hypothetical protein
MNMGDNQRYIAHNEEVVEAGQPDQTVVSQTQTSTTTDPTMGTVRPAPEARPVAPAATQATVQTTKTTDAPGAQVYNRTVSDQVVDPAADKAATVDWISRVVWFVVGVMDVLIAIRFVLLATGANENAGFAQLIYGLTNWMVAPFASLFGQPLTYPGAAGTAVFEVASLVAIVVYALVGLLIVKIAQLMLGTNRTTGTVYSESEHKTKV